MKMTLLIPKWIVLILQHNERLNTEGSKSFLTESGKALLEN